MDALEANIEQEDKFTDILHSPTCVFRTVAHNVPLLKVELIEWSEDSGEPAYTDLQKEWYEYWSASGIWAISTFSKQFLTRTHTVSRQVVRNWVWKMESFKTEWKLPIPMSSRLLALALDG